MQESELLDMANQLAMYEDAFHQWASCHIRDSIREWHENSNRNLDTENEEIALHFDAKWLSESRNEEEMMSLLLSWYNKREALRK